MNKRGHIFAGLTTTWAAHLGAVLPMCVWPAITCYNIYDHSLLTKPIEVVGGFHEVPTGPGLGAENAFCGAILMLKTIILTRQAQDKHRGTHSKKESGVFLRC